MCTITYIPTESGYIVTQNRDESPLREKAIFPVKAIVNKIPIIYPKDPEGSGSWFVTAQNGITLCVMNAVYHPDKTSADFKHSRGLVPLHYLDYSSSEDFVNAYKFEGIQGFTLIVCSREKVDEIHWDENKVTHTTYKPGPLIFQSNPLYNSIQKAKRRAWFEQWLNTNDSSNIIEFHQSQQQNNLAESILMDRQIVRSVSITQRIFSSITNQIQYAEVESLKNFQKMSLQQNPRFY